VRYSRVVAVLSGGGAKSAAHLGGLKALEDWNLTPSHYVGTSMGAVIAACFACGLTYEEILARVAGISRASVARVSPLALLGPLAPALLRGAPLRQTISDLVPARRFDELKVPLTVTATDGQSGQLVLFGDGGWSTVPLVDALHASCALPVFYPPVTIDGRVFVDGGLRAVLPLDVAAQFDPELIFAVNVGPAFAEGPAADGFMPPLVRAHDVATRILMAEQTAATIERWRESPVPLILVEPEVEAGTFAVNRAFHHVEEGYRAAYRRLSEWQAGAEKPKPKAKRREE